MTSVKDVAIGIVVEAGIFSLAGAFVYRTLAGRFLIPKREMVLLFQKGVLLRGDQRVRVVEPGTCWVRPGHKLILCDVRARALQLEGLEVLTGDGGVLQMNLSGEYRVSDPSAFVCASSNAGDKMIFDLRQTTKVVSRNWTAALLQQVGGAELLAGRVLEQVNTLSGAVGLELTSLKVWDIFQRGWVTTTEAGQSEPVQ